MPTLTGISQSPNVDVSVPLQAAIDAVPAGGTLDVPCYSKFRADVGVAFKKPITVNANESLIYVGTQGDSGRCNVRVPGADVVLRRLHTQGAKPVEAGYDSKWEGQHGFNLTDGKGTVLEGCGARDQWGDLIYVNRTKVCEINDFLGTRSGRAWMSLIDAYDLTVARPILTDSGRSGFNCEPHGADNIIDLVTISGGTLGHIRLNMIAMYGSQDALVNRFSFLHNTLIGSGLNALIQGSPTHWTRTNLDFSGNTSDTPLGNPQQAAMLMRHAKGVKVLDNAQPMGLYRNMHMVGTTHCEYVEVHGNQGANLAGQVIAV